MLSFIIINYLSNIFLTLQPQVGKNRTVTDKVQIAHGRGDDISVQHR